MRRVPERSALRRTPRITPRPEYEIRYPVPGAAGGGDRGPRSTTVLKHHTAIITPYTPLTLKTVRPGRSGVRLLLLRAVPAEPESAPETPNRPKGTLAPRRVPRCRVPPQGRRDRPTLNAGRVSAPAAR